MLLPEAKPRPSVARILLSLFGNVAYSRAKGMTEKLIVGVVGCAAADQADCSKKFFIFALAGSCC